jgi:hypothetical protein
VKEWLESGGLRIGGTSKKEPTLEKEYMGILVDHEGAWIIQAGLVRWPLPAEKWAIGSGRDFAVAAMSVGKSAAEAVAIACQFDCYSGLPWPWSASCVQGPASHVRILHIQTRLDAGPEEA